MEEIMKFDLHYMLHIRMNPKWLKDFKLIITTRKIKNFYNLGIGRAFSIMTHNTDAVTQNQALQLHRKNTF